MSTSIPISGLGDVSTRISADDLFPLVDSASLTTYRSSISELNGWMAQSGSVLSASYASMSKSSSYAPVQPSYSASVSTYIGTKQDTLVTGNTYTITSSWANNSITSSMSISSSYSITSSIASSASYFNFSVSSPPIVTSSISSSWSSASLSASYANASSTATSASYSVTASSAITVPNTANVGIAKAFLTFWVWGKPSQPGVGAWTSPVIVSSHNISSVVYNSSDLTNPNSVSYPLKPYINEQWRITFTTPMSDGNYTVIVGGAGEEQTQPIHWAIYPFAQDANGFYVSRVGPAAGNTLTNQHDWCQLVVFKA